MLTDPPLEESKVAHQAAFVPPDGQREQWDFTGNDVRYVGSYFPPREEIDRRERWVQAGGAVCFITEEDGSSRVAFSHVLSHDKSHWMPTQDEWARACAA